MCLVVFIYLSLTIHFLGLEREEDCLLPFRRRSSSLEPCLLSGPLRAACGPPRLPSEAWTPLAGLETPLASVDDSFAVGGFLPSLAIINKFIYVRRFKFSS